MQVLSGALTLTNTHALCFECVCVCVNTKIKTNEYEESTLIQTNEHTFFLRGRAKKNGVLNYIAYAIVDSIFVLGSKMW